jgi:phenylpropionate dioxygenase-like ring-hydroxylating dioxygenase large terminal subunit
MNLPGPPREHWYLASTSDALRARPLARTILGDPLVLFRAADGAPAALLDRCAHRNLALSGGRCVSGTVECAYHGWRYDGSGACVAIPSLAEGVPGRIGVTARPALERDGFIWVWMGARAPEGAPRPFPHWREGGWTSFVMVNRFQAGALACLENFLDCPHTAFVHQGWFRSQKARDVPARVETTADEVKVEFDERPAHDSAVSRFLFPPRRRLVHTDRFQMPSTSRVDYDFGPDWHFVITSQCTPVTDELTDVYTVVSFRAFRLGPVVRLFFEPMCRRIIRQDLDVLEAQTENVRRFGGPRFTSVTSDLVGPRIQRLWRDAANGAAALAPGTHAGLARERPAAREVVLRF